MKIKIKISTVTRSSRQRRDAVVYIDQQEKTATLRKEDNPGMAPDFYHVPQTDPAFADVFTSGAIPLALLPLTIPEGLFR